MSWLVFVLSSTIQCYTNFEVLLITAVLLARNDVDFKRGTFRVKGDNTDIYLAYGDKACRVVFFGDEIEEIELFDPVSGGTIEFADKFSIFPANIFSTTKERIKSAVWNIQPRAQVST